MYAGFQYSPQINHCDHARAQIMSSIGVHTKGDQLHGATV